MCEMWNHDLVAIVIQAQKICMKCGKLCRNGTMLTLILCNSCVHKPRFIGKIHFLYVPYTLGIHFILTVNYHGTLLS